MTSFLAPMLVSEIPGHRDRIMSQDHVFVQPKLNGWCCMANTRTRKLYSRKGNEIKTLPHINAALPVNGPEWLHGELYVHPPEWFDTNGLNYVDFIQSMIKRGSDEIEFHVFDCVSDKPFTDRFYYYPIQDYLNDPIKCVFTDACLPHEISDYYDRFISQGYEGLIIRLDGHGYEHRRSVNVFKMKPGTEVI